MNKCCAIAGNIPFNHTDKGIMTIDETINEIHKELHANMNGIASKYLRENGAQYRLNWGVELPRLQQIAQEFEPNHSLAQRLWNENVRESRILATMLMPAENFDIQLCLLWGEQVQNAEIAQMAVMHLFVRLPYAAEIAFRWMASGEEMHQLMGLLLVTRLIMQGTQFNGRTKDEIRDQAECALISPNLHVRKAAQNTISRLEEDN